MLHEAVAHRAAAEGRVVLSRAVPITAATTAVTSTTVLDTGSATPSAESAILLTVSVVIVSIVLYITFVTQLSSPRLECPSGESNPVNRELRLPLAGHRPL